MDQVAASRRDQALGAPSARSLLLTVLGEYVLPTGGRAWTGTLVTALGLLGVEEKSARQALARSAGRGWLTAHRSGRHVAWELTAGMRRLLHDGADRIYGFGRSEAAWDGYWLLLFTAVPAERREVRERLRTRLGWAGFGAFAPGTWVSVRPEARAAAAAVLTELDLTAESSYFVGRFDGDADAIVQRAWDLAAVAADYESFADEVEGWRPTAPADAFVSQTRLVHAWRRFPFLDPDLPTLLLPPDWAGRRAALLFHRQHQRWQPEAMAWWTEQSTNGQPSA